MQAFGLAQNGARMLQQGPPGLGRRHTGAPARQQRDAECILHIANPRRSGGERKVRALGAVGDAARLDHVPKKTEIGKVKPHPQTPDFAFREVRLCQNLIVTGIHYC